MGCLSFAIFHSPHNVTVGFTLGSGIFPVVVAGDVIGKVARYEIF
jgi:hypothetical protein